MNATHLSDHLDASTFQATLRLIGVEIDRDIKRLEGLIAIEQLQGRDGAGPRVRRHVLLQRKAEIEEQLG